ncbi:C6 zinc finger protein [Colletotrichum salicis]|uniref:C6 zinc finger protein n=1 Tax=Colletotrichum salicis TaxID=1209931 RepID=A0A135TXQ9_9PEZI|nr:C6 zinc finger protein [Colletotrichum salicis]
MKAWKNRDDYLASQQGIQLEEPSYVRCLRQVVGSSLSRSATEAEPPVHEDILSAEIQVGEQASMDQLFSTYLGAATTLDALVNPDEERIERQLSKLEGFDMTTPRGW